METFPPGFPVTVSLLVFQGGLAHLRQHLVGLARGAALVLSSFTTDFQLEQLDVIWPWLKIN